MKLFNFLLPFTDFLYILQLEEYENERFLKWLPRFFLRRNFQVREKLVLTQRAKLTLFVAFILWFLVWILGVSVLSWIVSKIAFTLLWSLFVPGCVLLANSIVGVFSHAAQERIRLEVKEQVATLPLLKVITVGGSYGKTTVKNFIYQLVQFNFRTQMIPGNINTAMGIAMWIKNNLQPQTEVLIVEVDTYRIGEIQRSCEVVPADIAVLTSIGDQHLERLGSVENLIKALSELFTSAKPEAHLILPTEAYALLTHVDIGERSLHAVDAHPPFRYQDQELDVSRFSTSNKSNLRLALEVAELLKIPAPFVVDTVARIELPERRQRLTELYGYEAIDDSYNISYSTALVGLEVAKQHAAASGRKLLVVTAGIPELSEADSDKNTKLGQILANTADKIVVLESMFAPEIVAGIKDTSKYECFKDLITFIKNKEKYPASEWFLLMQPELNDLYY